MAESKYGRLFTEADAVEMIRLCLSMQPGAPAPDLCRDMAENAVREWPGTFPADEPLLLLRASEMGERPFARSEVERMILIARYVVERQPDERSGEWVTRMVDEYVAQRAPGG